jgi:hypothetical protein
MTDAATGEILWWFFDDVGHPPLEPARGAVDDDGALVLVKHTPRGTQRATFALDGDRLAHRIAVRLAGQESFATVLEADYRRTGDAAPARTTAPTIPSDTTPAQANASRTSAS